MTTNVTPVHGNSFNFSIGQELTFMYHQQRREVEVIDIKGHLVVTRELGNQDIIKSYAKSKIFYVSEVR